MSYQIILKMSITVMMAEFYFSEHSICDCNMSSSVTCCFEGGMEKGESFSYMVIQTVHEHNRCAFILTFILLNTNPVPCV